jgi:hypothetical protein
MSAASRASLLLLAAAVSACTDSSLHFGEDPRFLWWTDHETGDLSDWLGKSQQGGFVLPGESRVEVVEGIAHSGTHALRITDDSPTQRDFPLAARNGPLPSGVYTSAWYYVPETLHPISYWWFVLYRSRHPPYDFGSFRDELRLSFTNRADGSMGTVLLSAELGTIQPLVDLEVPIARWFHVETYLRATDGADGEFKAWQDGQLYFQANGKMMETSWAEWMTGGVVDGLSTSANQLYIDDAAVSEQQLGPLPPFVRE